MLAPFLILQVGKQRPIVSRWVREEHWGLGSLPFIFGHICADSSAPWSFHKHFFYLLAFSLCVLPLHMDAHRIHADTHEMLPCAWEALGSNYRILWSPEQNGKWGLSGVGKLILPSCENITALPQGGQAISPGIATLVLEPWVPG